MHAKFVEILPFEDGNGRTGRALMNWVLIQADYPKLFIQIKLKEKYYKVTDLHNTKKYKEYCNMMFDIVLVQLSRKKVN